MGWWRHLLADSISRKYHKKPLNHEIIPYILSDKKERIMDRWYIDFSTPYTVENLSLWRFEIQKEIIDFQKRWIIFHFPF